ncbi:MAG: hypothetical protein ACOYOB_15790 [Myxococcota bacterium]|jgi:hypothetical protein
MSTKRNHKALLPTYVGAAVSFIVYLVIGAVPGTLYGGYMGLIMTGALFGTPVEPTMMAKVITTGGMALGLFASLFLFLVAGAFIGTLLGWPFAPMLRAEEKTETRTETVEVSR